MPKLSIIIPVYNAEKYILRCVESIIRQTFQDFELILIDDGSTDKSGILCDSFAETDKRIRVIHKNNGGVSSARNHGLNIAKGEFIMFCDSDDYVNNEWCQYMFELMKRYDNISLGLCGFESVDVHSNKTLANITYSKTNMECTDKDTFWKLYSKSMLNMPWNKIYRTDVIRKNEIKFDERIDYNEDLLFVLEYIKKSEGKFAICNIPLYSYVQGIESSLTHRYVPNLWEIKKRVFNEIDYIISQTDIDINKIQRDYYTKAIWHILSAVSSELGRNNNSKVYQKFKNLRDILKSNICKKSFLYGDFEETATGMYACVMKSRNTILIMLYYWLSQIKQSK